MLGNEKFDRDEILKAHRERTIKRMACESVILAVQDTIGVRPWYVEMVEIPRFLFIFLISLHIYPLSAAPPSG
jgi:hypothetical protein